MTRKENGIVKNCLAAKYWAENARQKKSEKKLDRLAVETHFRLQI
jgi:hypothetical protein